MIIGLGLAPSAISQIGLGGTENIDWRGVLVALVTFLTTVIVMVRGKGFIKIVPFLIGIITGYIVSIIVGLVDFGPVLEASFFSIPSFVVPFISYAPSFSAVLIM